MCVCVQYIADLMQATKSFGPKIIKLENLASCALLRMDLKLQKSNSFTCV